MNFKLKGQPNLLSSISLIQHNLFLNSFSHAKASQNDSQQMTDSACKSGQFIPPCTARIVLLAGPHPGKFNYQQNGIVALCPGERAIKTM